MFLVSVCGALTSPAWQAVVPSLVPNGTPQCHICEKRLRDGASSWSIFEDPSQSGRFLETFLVAPWTEHLRQHQRVTHADYVLQARVIALLQEEPEIAHFIAPKA